MLRVAAAVGAVALFALPQEEKRWYKGNLHTHTINSDGDSSPADVTAWYKNHGYQFLSLSDHNVFTDPGPLNARFAEEGKFLLVPSEEVTDQYEDKPVHINAYNLNAVLQPAHGKSVVDVIQNNVNRIRSAGATPSLNHPNFEWAVTSRDLLAVEGLPFFEVYNGHFLVNNKGGGGSESTEEMWDALLSAGRRVLGVAVDDAHSFKRWGRGQTNPGRGWIMVRSRALTREAIFQAIEQGDFYASTGVELLSVQTTSSEYQVAIQPAKSVRYTTWFIGDNGKVLGKNVDTVAVHRFRGSERYVRARVEDSNGNQAWTQPVFRR